MVFRTHRIRRTKRTGEAEYEEALSGAKKESAEIVDKARIDARAEYDRIVGEAGAKAGNIIENAKENVRIEREQTMKELQSQIAGLADRLPQRRSCR